MLSQNPTLWKPVRSKSYQLRQPYLLTQLPELLTERPEIRSELYDILARSFMDKRRVIFLREAIEELRADLKINLEKIDVRFDQAEQQFQAFGEETQANFYKVDQRFEQAYQHFDNVENR
jgi:hypothetical protein